MKSLLLPFGLAMTTLTSPAAIAQQTQASDSTQTHTDAHGHDHGNDHSHASPSEISAGTFDEVAGDHVIGKEDAPVTLIMYASVTCPHCAAWFNNHWPELKRDYVETGKLRFVFREFPTAPAQLAVANFALANCAPKEAYFENIEYQMRTQTEMFDTLRDESLSNSEIVERILNDRGTKAGVLEAELQTCLSTQSHYNKINLEVARARAAGIMAVPGIVLDGELYTSEDSSAKALSTAIDAIIAP